MCPAVMEARRVMLLAVLAGVVASGTAAGQARTRVFVEPFENQGGPALREAVIKLLSEQKAIVLVNTEADADRVLAGEGETHIKGYLSQNPRVRYVNRDSRPVYKGFLSVELRDKHHEPLWSYLATPRRYGAED